MACCGSSISCPLARSRESSIDRLGRQHDAFALQEDAQLLSPPAGILKTKRAEAFQSAERVFQCPRGG